jgi:hypothetical protein
MSDRSIREAIQYLAGNHRTDKVTLIDATVNSVDEAARTCECTAVTGSVGSPIPGVRLMASVDDGILVIPAVDSTVAVAMSIFTDPLIISYSEVDRIILRGGDLGGLVKVADLVSRLNLVEADINNLKSAFSAWTPVPNDGGAALKASSATWTGQQLAETIRADIENENITQG